MKKFWYSTATWLTLGLIYVLLFAPASQANDWPQWRGPERDGVSRETGWLTSWPESGPKKLWEQNIGIGYSSFSVSNGRLYTMGNVSEIDNIYCFDSETGKLEWKHEYPCPSKDPNGYHGTRCTPTVDANRVYAVSRQGNFFCLDASSGKVNWSKDFKTDFDGKVPVWGFAGSPLIEKDWVLAEVSGKASVVAFNKLTGQVVWQAGTDPAGYGSLVAFDLDGQRCFLQFSGDHLICRKMKDGSEMWRFLWKTSYGVNATTPIVQGDEVFVSTGYGYGCALLKMSPAGAKEIWRNKNMRNHVNSCVLVNGFIYGFDESELKCLDWKTGEVKWGNRNYGKGSLMAADGKLILYGQSGKLGVAEATPAAFKELCSFQALTGKDTWASPVLANGRIYVRNLDKVLALDVKKGTARAHTAEAFRLADSQ
jgi:outer membrane protein assembly factor BamB